MKKDESVSSGSVSNSSEESEQERKQSVPKVLLENPLTLLLETVNEDGLSNENSLLSNSENS